MSHASEGLAPSRIRGRQLRALIAALLLLPGATGCYAYTPLWSGTPAPGAEVALTLTDRGRVALAGPLGPGARRIVGTVASASDSAYILRVREVSYIDAPAPARWTGEQLVVARDYVGGTEERRLSKSRTWIAVGVFAGGLALASTIAIKGFGSGSGDTKVGGGSQTQ